MLVFYHVVGGDPLQGLRIADGVYRWLADGLAFARMPVFAALAGYAYCYSRDTGLGLIRKKAMRLLLPTLVVGTLFSVVRDGVREPDWGAGSGAFWHWMPVGHFWFLQSLFLIFVLVFFLERWRGLTQPGVCFAVFLFCCATYLWGVATPVLGIAGAFYLAPFFFWGLLTARLRSQMALWLGRTWWALLPVLVFSAMESFSFEQRDNVFHLLSGVVVSALAMQFMPRVGFLVWVGRYSFEVFLWHVFFTAMSRSLLFSLGYSDVELLVLIGVLSGVLGPVLISKFCGSLPAYRLLVLGNDRPARRALDKRTLEN